MKKLFLTGLIAALAFSQVAQAELEISGSVTTMVGYQHDNVNAGNTTGSGGLTQGDLRWAPTARADHFGFLVDQAELDVENEFGENIMARMDLDFIDLGSPSASAFFLEQAYVTANLGIGNGMEFLVGKFNAPVGLESVDRHENVFSTYTPGWVFLEPTQVLGMKFYYDFSDTWNFDFAVVNSMNGSGLNSGLPSAILRVGANWGDEGRESFWHIALGFGPEYSGVTGAAGAAGAVSHNTHYDALLATWGNFALGEYWDLGWELVGRRSNTVVGATNQSAFAGQLYGVYQASDVWTVQFRGAYFHEFSALAAASTGASTTGTTWSGHQGKTYSGTLGATYQITDDAHMKLEYRFDLAATTGTANPQFHTGVAEFGYSF
jgi:hypothetical protein